MSGPFSISPGEAPAASQARRPRHRLRPQPHLHAQEEDHYLHRHCRPAAGPEGGRRRNLGRHIHDLRPRIHRL